MEVHSPFNRLQVQFPPYTNQGTDMDADELNRRTIEIPPAELGPTATPIQRGNVNKAIKAIIQVPKGEKPSNKLKKKDGKKKGP